MNESYDLHQEFLNEEYAHAYMEEFLNASIATQIKVLREQRHWSKAQLAERAEITKRQATTLENVNYSSWSIGALRKLAKAFDLRLKVSFETFSSGFSEIHGFGRDSLQRVSRAQDLEGHGKIAKEQLNVTSLSQWMAPKADQIGREAWSRERPKALNRRPDRQNVVQLAALRPSGHEGTKTAVQSEKSGADNASYLDSNLSNPWVTLTAVSALSTSAQTMPSQPIYGAERQA